MIAVIGVRRHFFFCNISTLVFLNFQFQIISRLTIPVCRRKKKKKKMKSRVNRMRWPCPTWTLNLLNISIFIPDTLFVIFFKIPYVTPSRFCFFPSENILSISKITPDWSLIIWSLITYHYHEKFGFSVQCFFYIVVDS